MDLLSLALERWRRRIVSTGAGSALIYIAIVDEVSDVSSRRSSVSGLSV